MWPRFKLAKNISVLYKSFNKNHSNHDMLLKRYFCQKKDSPCDAAAGSKKDSGEAKDKKKPLHNEPSPRAAKDPPSGYEPKAVCHEALHVPDYIAPGIFREFKDLKEPIGPCIKKDSEYKNAEYYAYHRFSYYDLKGNTLSLKTEAQCADESSSEKDPKE